MKQPIEWHMQCLDNRRKSLKEKREALLQAQADYDRCSREVSIYEGQVQRAINEGRDGFDAERFGKRRK